MSADLNTTFRSHRGKSINESSRYCDTYESIHFGSPAYILEDELNEMQWIQISKRAEYLRNEMTSGFIKTPSIIYDINNRTLSYENNDELFLIGGYQIKINPFSLSNISIDDTIYVKLTFESIQINNDDRIGKLTSKRIVPKIEIIKELPDECSNEHAKDNYYFVFNNSNEYTTDEFYISKICVVLNNEVPSIFLAKRYQIGLEGPIVANDQNLTSNKNATIRFSNCEITMNSKNYGTKNDGNMVVKAWHSNAQEARTFNTSTSTYDYNINAGILSDGIWNGNINKYVQIGDSTNPPIGTLVAWGPNATIPGAIVDSTNKLSPGAKINLVGDVKSTVKSNFVGNTDYNINVELLNQEKLKPTKILAEMEMPTQQKNFYNKFTVNKKGVITSGALVTKLSELGITQFDIDAARDWSIIKYDSSNSKWTSKNGLISNIDKNFTYASDDGIENGSVDGSKFSFSGNTRILYYDGTFSANKLQSATGADIAEKFEVDNDDFEPGDIISINEHGKYIKSNIENDNNVIGVYSDSYGYCLNNNSNKSIPIGLCGRVYVKVTGEIKIGDLITTSNIDGIGIKSKNNIPGTIIGKALENHNGNNIDKIRILILSR